ncbi:transcriptional repressor TraM [Ensifer sp. SSB1]|uniref:transcriptional repressor TraM n=1 Tax=Ensifer sp. SSB1 TaxID=2795385 RepID=UPI001A5A3245|nr:transcriptional repressor TraM [Ensifer sp. SSB1]MBK5570821.1 transcriptional repressor TraM [Ensifer sp. SSB1]
MEDAEFSKDKGADGTSRYGSMGMAELEMLAVSAIREHRVLLAADQAVYEEWLHASDDPSISSAVLQTLQDEYLARQKKSEAQQAELSEILDALGFVPDVRFDDDEQASDEVPIFGNGVEVSN